MTAIRYTRDMTKARITATGHQDNPVMCAGISAMMCALVNGLDEDDLIDGKIESGAVDVTLRRSPRADAMFDLTVRGFKAMRSEYGDKLRVVKGD